MTYWKALFLGLLEGLTEFIPVSSTGHILLAGQIIGFESPKKAFEILIQLGAVLAIVVLYAEKFLGILVSLRTDLQARRFIMCIFLAFVPAAIVGPLAYPIIKTVLFETPLIICCMLIAGGGVLLYVDRQPVTKPLFNNAMTYSPSLAFKIGLFQCMAIVPGVSRSGATIVGALLMGTDKRSAAEFSFFLAIPTMLGAFSYELYKNWSEISANDIGATSIGFVAAFLSGLLVVRHLLSYVATRGYKVFGWWRIAVGTFGLIYLLLLPAQ